MLIRPARSEDVEAMRTIYAPFVQDNSVSFELVVPTIDEFSQRVSNNMRNFPWLVAEEDNIIIGYAYASIYRERLAYQWNAECSIYLNQSARGQGRAELLYEALFRLLVYMGICNVYAIITLPNESSTKFHARMGFENVGTFKSVGFKMAEWHDVFWMVKFLQHPANPQPPKKFSALSTEEVEHVIHG